MGGANGRGAAGGLIEHTVSRDVLADSCLLCSEDKPHHCHRRLVRRTFEVALKSAPDASLQAYPALYDALLAKLRDMAGPVPDRVEKELE